MFFLYTICKTSSIETKHPFCLPFSLKTIIMKLKGGEILIQEMAHKIIRYMFTKKSMYRRI